MDTNENKKNSDFRSFGTDIEKRRSGQVLDSPEEAIFSSVTVYELAQIFAAMGLDKDMAGFAVVAADLSRIAGRVDRPTNKRTEMPWTKKYVHSVYHGKLEPSPEFARIVEKLAQMVNGQPVGMAGAAMVKVYADPAKVPEGTLIPANAEVRKCERPGCPIEFVKTNYFQKYHDPSCRKK